MKVLIFSPSDGSIWRIPAEVVAKSRAEVYARGMAAKGYDYEVAFKELYDHLLSVDDKSLISWFRYSTPWRDVKEVAKMVEPPSSYDADDVECAKMEVKEVPHG